MREFEREFEDMFRAFDIGESGERPFKPYVYGFRITVGPDGKPKVEEFGNVKRIGSKPKIAEEIEPLVDVIEEEDIIKVVAEMPGVEKEKVKVKATEDTLTIQGTNTNRKYYKELKLPANVKPETAKATYRNGVLEVTLEKAEKRSKSGVEVKIE
ncbi:MAG: Hsp20/alpha crystallin family protein [Sulfolobales archaeon]|nr:Hsp20/alpha crystallin family protein [Sulfolobales archaeon]MCX8186518.1 Hsp20/alpha crystallin family protein [Sulfolobales archaeon]